MWTSHRLVSFDGTPLSYHIGHPDRPAKAVLLVVHGMGEHGGRYQALAEFLAGLDLEVIALDLRGFGQSGGRPVCVRQFSDYLEDLSGIHAWISRTRNLPIFFLGHSFGGLVIASYTAAGGKLRPSGVILSSPLFGVSMRIPRWRHILGIAASYVAPNWTQDNRVEPHFLTHDEEVLRVYEQDSLIRHKISARLYREMTKQMSRSREVSKRISLPILILQAGEDHIVSRRATEDFFQNLQCPQKELKIYEGFYHEIINETQRQEVYSRIGLWIISQISPK